MMRFGNTVGWVLVLLLGFGCSTTGVNATTQAEDMSTPPADCPEGLVTARVVALDQPIYLNRLGSYIPAGMIFALEDDVVAVNGETPGPGNATLREGKRPRPLVLRVNEGQCLDVVFKNWLSPSSPTFSPPTGVSEPTAPKTRAAGLHIDGTEWRKSSQDDGSYVGANPSSLLEPSTDSFTYHLRAPEQGTFLLYSTADTISIGDAFFPVGGQLSQGMFGALHVEPPDAEHYRSQITHEDLELAKSGETAAGQPLLNWDARYPDDSGTYGDMAGKPILRMIDPQTNEIVHSDLTAVITGPNRGDFTGENPSFVKVASSPDRRQPFREVTIIYHEVGDVATQAFDQLRNPPSGAPVPETALAATIANGDDGFAINYGAAGIVNEILANRFEVGPMKDCADCKFEEFFLSAWSVGDPAMVTDQPTWVPGGPEEGEVQPDAVVPYPDDPSNVYHSYLWDHVKFRVLHGGASLHHLHHQHAHQWLHTPDSDTSDYLDSQAIGPGSGFTLEMVYNSSGNKNLTVGDSIFHCHFYPHFAQGMWSLWRVHDVFEEGSPLDENGHPTGRALPDGEITAGTPIPALVPLPTRPMAPMPAPVRIADGQVDTSIWPNGVPPVNPGFPFFIPGIAGSRAPHPPLDLAFDGGLPRHIIGSTGNQTTEIHNYQNFEKDAQVLNARQLDEQGEPIERVAMDFHRQRTHQSFTPENQAQPFVTNGLRPVSGAPYADPCVTLEGEQTTTERTYKAANLQHDVVLSKEGYHFPQLRMIALWEDVVPTLENTRPAQPFFFRANSGDCIVYHHTNLVPDYYELDAFQVRTPTDILGQHIHLVKFDVTSSDGAANGWNYEDGAFSPQEVQGRIEAINAGGGLLTPSGQRVQLTPEPHPYFGQFPQYEKEWLGAQTEIQRWYADPLLDNSGDDRTLRTVFTHDHFSPSTHQQAGLYAGLLVEPKNSKWFEPATGEQLGVGRMDGGPTSWQATIEFDPGPGDAYKEPYREFGLLLQDYQLAYQAGYGYPAGPSKNAQVGPDGNLISNPDHFLYGTNQENVDNALTPPINCAVFGNEQGTQQNLATYGPCPQLVSQFQVPQGIYGAPIGTVSVNYRLEPVEPRLQGTPSGTGPDPNDPINLFLSLERPYQGTAPYGTLNTQTPPAGSPGSKAPPQPLPPLTAGMEKTDPYTPLLRAYMGDNVEIATLTGAHLDIKNWTVQGVRWLSENFWENSGWRASQHMGLSEHFEFDFQVPATEGAQADYLYEGGAATSDVYLGAWGLLRAYHDEQPNLRPMSNNPPGSAQPAPTCPDDAPERSFEVWAVTAADVVPGGTLVYSDVNGNQIVGTDSILYVLSDDVDPNTGKLLDEIEQPYPLVLRAAAGECIQVTLINKLTASPDGTASDSVGLYPQLVTADITQDAGFNAGFNPVQTVAPGGQRTYTWYAGIREVTGPGEVSWTPVEFGSANLVAADPLFQQPLGLGGALIIEPEGSTWEPDPGDRTQATVTPGYGEPFREFVVMMSNSMTLGYQGATTSCPTPLVAINYTNASLYLRDPALLSDPNCSLFDHDLQNLLSNSIDGEDPTGPIFTALAGQEARFRLLNPGSTNQNEIFTLHGHVWQEKPYVDGSTRIGDNPLSNNFGAWAGHGPLNHFDVVIPSAGGENRVPGDYLFQTFNMADFPVGMWGIFRVQTLESYE